MNNSPDRIWRLVSKKLAGEASPEEIMELKVLLQTHPEMNSLIESAEEIWKTDLSWDRPDEHRAFTLHMKRMAEETAKKERAAKAMYATKPGMKERLWQVFHSGVYGNYIKVIWRNLYRFKGFSFINITGLAVGMASAILILLLVQNELSYDQFHKNNDRIFMVYNSGVFKGKIESWSGTPMSLAPILKNDFPQIEEVARLNGTGPLVLSVDEKHIETRGNIVDPSFLKIFSYPLLKGNPEDALNSPRSIVITEDFSRKLFGSDDAMGKIIRVDSNAYFTVSGVLKNLPNNTIFDFQYLLPWSYMKEVGWENPDWGYNGSLTFALLKPGIAENWMDGRIRDIVKTHSNGMKNELFLHPISKWRLYSRFENGKIAGGGIESVRLFSIIAIFILLIACINYMNLSTARSVKRAKEVGIRKVVGAGKRSIILRFLGESVMISFLAVIICLVIVQVGIGGFNWLTWNKLFVPYDNPKFWLGIFGFALFTGLLAGSYPAFYLSTFRPISVLKGTFKTAYHLVSVRKILVVLQFSFAITFIICTIIIYKQIEFARHRDPGYQRDHLAFVYVKGEMNKKYPMIKNALLNSGAVNSVTRSNSPICYIWQGDNHYTWKNSKVDEKDWIAEFQADNDFIKTMGLKIISGREINTLEYPGDSSSILLNESAVAMMGFKNPIGELVKNDKKNWTVVGVVKDFIANSPFYNVPPMIIQGPGNKFGAISFRLSRDGSMASNMQTVETIFKKYIPDYPIISGYVDQADAEKFEDERRTGIQSALFGGLAILISCLGLFALAAYTAENRIKEIGIRKVLGASVSGITMLLSKDFVKLVILSFIIASPIAGWMMHSWLQNYPYRVNISWWIFAISGATSMTIAILTVSYQAIKAAISNPVNSLRAE